MRPHLQTHWFSVFFAFSLVVALQGCSTESLDLSDIDTNLGWELKDFKLPGNNSTHDIVMQELIDIDTTGCIKVSPITGDYYFTKKGDDVEPTTTEVGTVSVTTNEQDIHPNPFKLSAEQLGIVIPQFARSEAPMKVSLGQTIQAFDVYENDLAGDIVRLDRATAEDAVITLTVHFSEDLHTVIDEVEELTFTLPLFFDLGEVKVQQNGKLLQVKDNSVAFGNIGTGADFIFTVDIDGVDFNVCSDPTADEYLIYSRTPDGKGDFKGEVEMKGQIDISATFDQSRLTTDAAKLRPDMQFVIDSELEISPITISSATGEFCPSIDFEMGKAEVNDIPALLDDPETKVKLHNLIIRFDVASTLGLTGIINGDLISHFKDQTSKSIHVNNIELKPEATSHIVICREQPKPGEYGDSQVFYKGHPDVTGDVQDLVDAIPETVEFVCTATTKAGETGTVYLGHTYTFTPSYEMEALLELDRGSLIVYRDTIDEWADDLEDIELAAGATVTIEAEATNNSPLLLNLDIMATDVNHQSLTGDIDVTVKTTSPDNTVPAEGTTHLTIVVHQNTDGAFRKLDGIIITARAHGQVEGKPLNSGIVTHTDQTLRLDKIGITLNGKVKVNIDD